MRKLLSGIALVAVMAPVMVSAATAEELAAQIEALLQQVSALQQQVGAGPTTPATGTGATTPINTSSIQCPLISRNLKKGMSGTDVTRLQQFLALDPSVYPEAQVTGYYGALTEAAVKKFQCKNKLVCDGTAESTGYGVTGPRTAALLALQCPAAIGNSDIVSGFIRATPGVGAAPLNVTIEAILNTAKSCAKIDYEITFGDSPSPALLSVPANTCAEMRQVVTHTYTAPGAYPLTLRSGVHQDTVTINVTGTGTTGTQTSSGGLNASPLSGVAPLSVVFSGTRNESSSCNAGTYTLQFGDGQSTQLPSTGCNSATFSIAHTYTTNGTYTARLYRDAATNEAKTATITVGSGGSAGAGGGPFSVTAGANGNPLYATASLDITSSCARYDLDWGDGTAHAAQAEGTCSAGSTTKQFSHTYTSAGTYTITLKRGASLSQTDTVALTIVR